MRTSAWVVILGLAGLAVACGDQPTEVVPDREVGDRQTLGRGTVALATASSGDGYSISTDKDDYQPGDVVHFTGAGWDPEDVLDIVLTDEPQTHAPHEWTVTIGLDGTFTDDSYTVDEGDLNVTFTLVATSRSSQKSLSMTFTDGNLQNVTLTPGSVSIPQTGSASSTINVTINGNSSDCTVTLNVLASPALPAGVSTSITPNNTQTGNVGFNRTLTFTTSSVTPGSYPFTLRGVRGSDCQSGSGNVDVNGTLVVFGAPHHLVFGQQPSNSQGGATITPALTVRVLDVNNNLVATGTTTVAMAIQNNPGSGTLSGTVSLAAVGGIATFSDLSIDKIGTAYTLRATSSGLTGITSSNFNVNLGPAAKLLFTLQPTGANTNANLGTQPKVGVFDAGGNLRTAGSVNVGLAVTPGTGSGSLSCTSNSVATASGIASFGGCKIDQAGTGYRLRASSGTLTSADSDPFDIVNADAAAPSVSCTVSDPNVWYGTNVNVPCTATDPSGLANPSADASFTLSTNVADDAESSTAGTGSRPVCDALNNCVTVGPFSFMVDRKAPVVSCGSADGAWHGSDVTIHCTATDGGSGVAGSGASFDLTTSVGAGNETADAQTDDREVADVVGNSATAGPIGGNKVDRKAPQFTCEAAPTAWSANDVTRECVAVDGGSGLDPATDGSFDLVTSVQANNESDNAQTGSKLLADAVGNKKTAGPLGNNKVDKKDPQVSCGTADADWHATDVSIGCSASDGGSGLADGGDASFNLTTAVAANTETATAATGFRDVADAVGHSVTAGPIPNNKVDKKAPAVSCGLADGAWHNNNVAIGCTASDGGSGLKVEGDASFNLVTTVAMGDETGSASTTSLAVLDEVGNSSTAGPVGGNKIDRKAPQITCGSADNLWHANDVAIGCTAADGGSGLADNGDASFNLNTSIATGTETANASTNSRYVLDDVGNSATAGPVGGNQVDKKGPTLNLTCPSAPLLLNQPASANWQAADGGSGVASGFLTGSFSVPTNTVGPHTATAAAGLSHDNVGNASTASAPCPYGVNYGFAGFFTPVDPNPAMNGANSGQAIPLKWTLKDFNGNPVTTLASVNVTAVSLSCSQGSTTDQIEEYAAGASGLINKGDGSYQFNWKTPTSYAKSCKTVKLDLGDGSPVKIALFEFKK
ncbi:MAG TPA: PxKF domain-containing protein [Gemmatimonadales bacterium]|nr:PxKF domain-containing protein [Gemmatimonadales bacterium]